MKEKTMAIFIMMESDEALLEALETVNEYQKPFCNNFVEKNDELNNISKVVQKEDNLQLFNETIESAREINERIKDRSDEDKIKIINNTTRMVALDCFNILQKI